jgi:hypothetical protein
MPLRDWRFGADAGKRADDGTSMSPLALGRLNASTKATGRESEYLGNIAERIRESGFIAAVWALDKSKHGDACRVPASLLLTANFGRCAFRAKLRPVRPDVVGPGTAGRASQGESVGIP